MQRQTAALRTTTANRKTCYERLRVKWEGILERVRNPKNFLVRGQEKALTANLLQNLEIPISFVLLASTETNENEKRPDDS